MTDAEKIKILLNQPEWEAFECKRVLVEPLKLLTSVIALANTNGGWLVLGLEDPAKAKGAKRLIGISEKPDNASEFLKLITKEIDPPNIVYQKHEIAITNTNGQPDKIIALRIEKSNNVHSLKKGDTFARKGSQNIKIGATEIMQIGYEKGTIKYENERADLATLEDLNYDLVNQYKADLESVETDDKAFLLDNLLATQHNGEFKLTKGAVLLFGKNPATLLGSKCSIKITRYYGNQPNYTGEPNFVERPVSIEGPLLHQIQQTMVYFRQVVRSSPPKLRGALFRPSFLVPEWVFQEAVTNAVIHRNYSIENDVQVRFFDDRVEIESPGSYPGPVTVRNIRYTRYSRNPIILRTLNRFREGPNMDIGEGVDRMYKIMDSKNLYEPWYTAPTIKPYSVFLTLFNVQKTEYWDTVSKYLNDNYQITNKGARSVTGIADVLKMSKLLRAWTKRGLLEMAGSNKRDIYYRKPGQRIPEISLSRGGDNEIDK